MNWPRYLRARAALNVESVERVRDLQQQGKLTAGDIDPATWQQIIAHDSLIETLDIEK